MWAAIDLGCDYLVTGDKLHFGALLGKMVEGVRVVRAEDIFREFGDQYSPGLQESVWVEGVCR